VLRGKPLTAREQQVAHLLSIGHTQKAIGGILGLDPRTIGGHRSRIALKLDLRNGVEWMTYLKTLK
jgi:DNA-binding CsgD family transcriptional regulator